MTSVCPTQISGWGHYELRAKTLLEVIASCPERNIRDKYATILETRGRERHSEDLATIELGKRVLSGLYDLNEVQNGFFAKILEWLILSSKTRPTGSAEPEWSEEEEQRGELDVLRFALDLYDSATKESDPTRAQRLLPMICRTLITKFSDCEPRGPIFSWSLEMRTVKDVYELTYSKLPQIEVLFNEYLRSLLPVLSEGDKTYESLASTYSMESWQSAVRTLKFFIEMEDTRNLPFFKEFLEQMKTDRSFAHPGSIDFNNEINALILEKGIARLENVKS